tara:strand:+ start:330 stop:1037 length:708 start_codon:yes stop_codon:yes gene_type:complete
MFRYLIFIFIAGSTVLAEKPYDAITKRNAFDLTSQSKVPVTLPPIPLSKGEVYLTGIVRKDKMYTAYMALKDKGSTKYLSLQRGETQDGITVDRITRNSVFIRHSGNPQELTFKRNRFPTIITRTATKPSSKEKKGERGERSKSSDSSKKASKAPTNVSRPHVVNVPSRRPKIDPRLIEKGLEYLSRTEDSEKREYIMKRLESLQSGQSRIKSDIDANERRRQYDEWRKSRENRN